jgi:hypothetical protein
MLKLIKTTEYRRVPGRRYLFEAEVPLHLGSLSIPRSDVLEVSVLEKAPNHDEPETAILYRSRIVAIIPGVNDPEVAVKKLSN